MMMEILNSIKHTAHYPPARADFVRLDGVNVLTRIQEQAKLESNAKLVDTYERVISRLVANN